MLLSSLQDSVTFDRFSHFTPVNRNIDRSVETKSNFVAANIDDRYDD